MAKLTKSSVFKAETPKAETAMDKTTRVVMKMIDDETEKRNTKIARLRKARLEREASTPAKAPTTAPKKAAPKTRAPKVAKK